MRLLFLDIQDYSECGRSPFQSFDRRARVIGGLVTKGRNWPWAVRIIVKGW